MQPSQPTQPRLEFVVCIKNEGHAGALHLRKLYQVASDAMALARGQLAVIDDTGAPQVYPQDYFLRLAVPDIVWRVVLNAK